MAMYLRTSSFSNQDQTLLESLSCYFLKNSIDIFKICILSEQLERRKLLEGDPYSQKLPDSQQETQDVAPSQVHGLPVSYENSN